MYRTFILTLVGITAMYAISSFIIPTLVVNDLGEEDSTSLNRKTSAQIARVERSIEAMKAKLTTDFGEKIQELEGRIRSLDSQLSLSQCASILASSHSLCDDVQKRETSDCCTPRPVHYADLQSDGKNDHWVYHSNTFDSAKVGFWINTHDPVSEDAFVSAAIQRNGLWEPEIVKFFAHKLLGIRPGLVLDVGSNLGYFTLWAAAMGHRVIAFEPMNYNLNRLASSVIRNDLQHNVSIYQNTVGTRWARLNLRPTNERNQGNFQVQDNGADVSSVDGLVYGKDFVETITLDQVVNEDVTLMKIDVEGFEFRVLDGARRLLCNNVVESVELEFTTVRRDSDCPAERLLCWLQALGYDITGLAPPAAAAGEPANTAGLRPRDFRSFPENLLLTLRDPFLPPAEILRISSSPNNPCAAFVSPPADEAGRDKAAAAAAARVQRRRARRARVHKARWCGNRFAAARESMLVCRSWGRVEARDRDVWAALDCDVQLGFNCSGGELRVGALRRAVMLAAGQDPARDSDPDWLEAFVRGASFRILP